MVAIKNFIEFLKSLYKANLCQVFTVLLTKEVGYAWWVWRRGARYLLKANLQLICKRHTVDDLDSGAWVNINIT